MKLASKALLMSFILSPLCSAQPHVHDEGQLLISQEGKEWQMQFNIPAVNAFGFEYEAKTKEEKKAVSSFASLIKNLDKVIAVDADCHIEARNDNLSHDDHKHDEHEHEHDKHEDEHQAHGEHLDAEFSYHLHCDSAITSAEVTLFKQLKSLHHIQVQWISDKGQGALELSPRNNKIQF